MAAIAAWVDGGQPRGAETAISGAPDVGVVAFRRSAPPLSIPASAAQAAVRPPSTWVGGWDFEPGDPLVTSATVTSADGAMVGTWVAGDGPVVLPPAAGMRVASPLRIQIARRKAADYEKPFAAKASVLRVVPLTTAPARRVWVEEVACNAPRTDRSASLLAVRPLLADTASARLSLERPGAPRAIIGWFRDTDARYPRTYWLTRPTGLPPESRVQSDAPCRLELTLIR
jgi:hypothetical protein